MTIRAAASRKSARTIAKFTVGKVKDLQPPRKILTLNGLSDKIRIVDESKPRFVVVS